MIRESEINIETWSDELVELLKDETLLVDMGRAARNRGVPAAAQQIVDDLRTLASLPVRSAS